MNVPEQSTLTRIGQIAINAHDIDRATAFYRDVLGLSHLFRAGHLSFFSCGGVRLMTQPAGEAPIRSSRFDFVFSGWGHSRRVPAPSIGGRKI